LACSDSFGLLGEKVSLVYSKCDRSGTKLVKIWKFNGEDEIKPKILISELLKLNSEGILCFLT